MSVRRNIQMMKMLSYFEQVVNNGQLKRAAEELGLKQSNLSREMKDLEILVGRPLLVRKGRGLAVTETGEKIYFRACACSQIISEVSDYIRQGVSDDMVNIRIPQSCLHLFSEYFENFKKQYPRATCRLQTAEVTSSGQLNEIDACVVFDKGSWQNINIICEGNAGFIPVTTQKYIDKYGYPKNIEDLQKNHRMCLCEEFGNLERLKKARPSAYRCIEYQVTGTEAMISLIREKHLVSIVPVYLLKKYPDLIPLRIKDWDLKVPLQLITAPGRCKITHIHSLCGQIINFFQSVADSGGLDNLVIYPFYPQINSARKSQKIPKN